MKNSFKLSILALLLLAACSQNADAPEATVISSAAPVEIEQSTATPLPDSPVAQVNGAPVSQASFEFSLALYQAALQENGTFLATIDIEQVVLDDLIARLLLAQAAREAGFEATPELVAERLQAAIEQAGGQADYEAWLQSYGFSSESFERELVFEIEAAWMRNEIVSAVPTHAEQVEARQILLSESFQAERLLGQLQGGTPFETVALNNDPQGLGYLGWFPRGYLLQAEVEEAAFALQPGDTSQIVESAIGYHLVEVLDRDENRELSPQARLELQRQSLAQWIADQRQQSDVQVLLP